MPGSDSGRVPRGFVRGGDYDGGRQPVRRAHASIRGAA